MWGFRTLFATGTIYFPYTWLACVAAAACHITAEKKWPGSTQRPPGTVFKFILSFAESVAKSHAMKQHAGGSNDATAVGLIYCCTIYYFIPWCKQAVVLDMSRNPPRKKTHPSTPNSPPCKGGQQAVVELGAHHHLLRQAPSQKTEAFGERQRTATVGARP